MPILAVCLQGFLIGLACIVFFVSVCERTCETGCFLQVSKLFLFVSLLFSEGKATKTRFHVFFVCFIFGDLFILVLLMEKQKIAFFELPFWLRPEAHFGRIRQALGSFLTAFWEPLEDVRRILLAFVGRTPVYQLSDCLLEPILVARWSKMAPKIAS